jgi:hypothetical protein
MGGGQLSHLGAVHPGDLGDVGVGPGPDGGAGLAAAGGQLGRLGAADVYRVPGTGPHELVHAGIGDQPALADHQQVVGGQGHLAHQVAGDQHGAALGGQRPHQGPDPVDAGAPFGPRKPVTMPGRMEKDRSSTAMVEP